ncbi:hypothetical protein M758_3G235100 [Ceratodon purpureus]|nr:hypothetical protein M758_3G235100 [Ceratodon purpureus]
MMASRTLAKLHIATIWSPVSTASQASHAHLPPRLSLGRLASLTHSGTDCSVGRKWVRPDAAQLRRPCSLSANASAATSTVAVSDLKEEDPVDHLGEFVLTAGKVTSVAHGVWRKVVRPGDIVIDATCGNGHDTLELAKMVCADNASGYVYAFDVQEDALANSSYLLDQHLDSVQRKRVKLLRLCHSQLEKIVGETAIRLVTFNLGYLPGGDHTVITNVDTTIQALQASSNVLQPGGLISVIAYVGHSGGREEFEAVMNFAANLPTREWVCSQHEWVNRPLSPRLILMCKR